MKSKNQRKIIYVCGYICVTAYTYVCSRIHTYIYVYKIYICMYLYKHTPCVSMGNTTTSAYIGTLPHSFTRTVAAAQICTKPTPKKKRKEKENVMYGGKKTQPPTKFLVPFLTHFLSLSFVQ